MVFERYVVERQKVYTVDSFSFVPLEFILITYGRWTGMLNS